MSDTSDPQMALRGLFKIAEGQAPDSIADSLREKWQTAAYANIDNGENPFRSWRMQVGHDTSEVAAALDVSLNVYQSMEKDIHDTEAGDIEVFCHYFKLHPSDLVNDLDVMPTSIAEVLTGRAMNAQLLPMKREKARFEIIDEIEKSARIMAQARLHTGEGRETLTTLVLSMLDLGNPRTHAISTYREVWDLVFKKAMAYQALHSEAKFELNILDRRDSRAYKAHDKIQDRMIAYWCALNDGDAYKIGCALEDVIKAKGFEFARHDFTLAPEDYGSRMWPSSRRPMIEGTVHNWESATDAFFDLLAQWYRHAEMVKIWRGQEEESRRELQQFDDWLEKPSTKDIIQAFANICRFANAFHDDPEIQARLAVFRRTPAHIAQKRVFNSLTAC